MMSFKDILDKIDERWIASERYELIQQFKEAPQGAATGTEGTGIIGSFLIDLKENNKEAYDEIEDLLDEFVILMKEHGLKFTKK
jgi:hypothetical protein